MFRRFMVGLLLVCVFCGGLPLVGAVTNFQGIMPSTSVVNEMNVLDDKVSNGSVFNDAKFRFACSNISEHSYKVTVSRKDQDFDNQYVQFIYNLVIQSNNRMITALSMLFLNLDKKTRP